jgi:hypothetical protein
MALNDKLVKNVHAPQNETKTRDCHMPAIPTILQNVKRICQCWLFNNLKRTRPMKKTCITIPQIPLPTTVKSVQGTKGINTARAVKYVHTRTVIYLYRLCSYFKLVLPKLNQLGIETLEVVFCQRMTITIWKQHGSVANLLCRNQIGM